MAEPKAKPPPPTEVLPGPQRPIAAGDTAPPNEEFVATPPVEPPLEAPVESPPQEPLEQPFEIDETPPDETPPEEDPQVTEAKRRMHEATQELAQNKKLLDAMLRQRELESMTPQAPQTPGPPKEFFDTKPSAEELADPNFFQRYVQRQLDVREYGRAQGEMVRDMRDFVDNNKDWETYWPTMKEIKNEDPYAYQEPGSVKSLYKRARERIEFQNMQAKLTEIQGQAQQAGANIEATKANRPFAAPGAGKRVGVSQKKGVAPPDFRTWDTTKQKDWLKANNLWKDDGPI